MAKKKIKSLSKDELLTELGKARQLLRSATRFEIIRQVGASFREILRWGGFAYFAHCGYRAVKCLAGKATLADIGVKLSVAGKWQVSVTVAWTLAGFAVAYGVAQRRLRVKTTAENHRRLAMLERYIDPKRSSSLLSPQGVAPEEDEP